MLSENLGSLLYGDVFVMDTKIGMVSYTIVQNFLQKKNQFVIAFVPRLSLIYQTYMNVI